MNAYLMNNEKINRYFAESIIHHRWRRMETKPDLVDIILGANEMRKLLKDGRRKGKNGLRDRTENSGGYWPEISHAEDKYQHHEDTYWRR